MDSMRRRLWLGILVVFYLTLTLRVLPWHYSDVSYAVLVEQGSSFSRAWAHPLFVPVFSFYRGLLRLLGYSGPMLLPIERLNAAAGAASLWVLFEITDDLIHDPLLSASCAGFFGIVPTVLEHTLIARSCAASFFFLTVAAYCLLRETLPRRLADIAAGLSCAAAAGFDIGAVAFLPAAAVILRSRKRGADSFREEAETLAAFLSGLLAAYALCASFHGLRSWGELFPETISTAGSPAESIWIQKSLLWQARTCLQLLRQMRKPLEAVVVLLALNWTRAGALYARFKIPARAFFVMAAASLLLYAVNDAQNDFFYESILFLPVMLAVLCSGRRWLRAGFIAFALVAARSAYVYLPKAGHSAAMNPVLSEIGFLHEHLDSESTLLIPGCPCAGLAYARAFRLVQVGEEGQLESAPHCHTAALAYGPALDARIRRELSMPGRAVYAAENNASPDPEDAERERMSGHAPKSISLERFRVNGFVVDAPVVSPLGNSYYRIRLKPRRG
jgi:hypothetical protein